MIEQQRATIAQPPFFRTRDRRSVLYSSSCYRVPDRPACVDTPIALTWNEKDKRYFIPKKNKKEIQFDGVDAMEFRDSWPTTEYVPLSKEVRFIDLNHSKECDYLFNKQKQEAVIVVEDEETKRNDSLLDEIDEMVIFQQSCDLRMIVIQTRFL